MRTQIWRAFFVVVGLTCFLSSAIAAPQSQDKTATPGEEAAGGKPVEDRQAAPIDPRVTPLGTQRPKPVKDDSAGKKEKDKSPTAPAETVARAAAAHGGRAALAAVRDSVATGKVTVFTAQGPRGTYDVSVVRKGDNQVQRIIKQSSSELREVSDGLSAWQSTGGFTARVSGGPVARFIASQTGRSVESALNFEARGLALRDGGETETARVLELDEPPSGSAAALKTRFFVDNVSSHVTRIEFVTGTAKDLFGKLVAATESYVYSDFRMVQGVSTPFHIERYIDGLKIEETQFTTVRYNTSVKDEVFKP